LFSILALIEFTWSAAVLLLERSDLQSWTAGVVRKLMWIGAFYALLLYGPTWIPAIVDSFIQLGQSAAHTGAFAPGDVYSRGLEIAGSLLKGSSDAGFFTNFGSALALVLAAFMVFLAFLVITVQFVVALVESYIVVSAGFIFLGFGGSRWTAPYVERYIGLAVSVGVKIMILYLLIGSGMTLSQGWVSAAVNVPASGSPSMSALDIVGAALIYMAVCWQAPKVIAGVIGGSPALTGGDVVSTAATIAGAAYFASSILVSGAKAASARLAGAGVASSGGSGRGSGSSGGGSGPSGGRGPSSGGGGSGGNGSGGPPTQPSAPAVAGKAGASNSDQVSPPKIGGDRSSVSASSPVSPTSQISPAATGDGSHAIPAAVVDRDGVHSDRHSRMSYARAGAAVHVFIPPSDAAPHAPPPRLRLAEELPDE
jgi:type IV secretion system protein TrbL